MPNPTAASCHVKRILPVLQIFTIKDVLLYVHKQYLREDAYLMERMILCTNDTAVGVSTFTIFGERGCGLFVSKVCLHVGHFCY